MCAAEFEEFPCERKCQSGSVHQSDSGPVVADDMEITPLSVLDERSQQDAAALHGSIAWAAKQNVHDNSLCDDRKACSFMTFSGFAA